MHEDPNVPNFGRKGGRELLRVGMVIAIEPMIAMGTYKNHTLSNGWTVVTNDGKPAAHYENTIAITKDGPVIITQDAEGPWCTFQGGE
jgi:methionyl aminopeptidase